MAKQSLDIHFLVRRKVVSRYFVKCYDLDWLTFCLAFGFVSTRFLKNLPEFLHTAGNDTDCVFPREDDTKRNEQLLNFLNNDDALFTGDRALTNAQRMCIENNGEPFDITSRFRSIYQSQDTCENRRA